MQWLLSLPALLHLLALLLRLLLLFAAALLRHCCPGAQQILSTEALRGAVGLRLGLLGPFCALRLQCALVAARHVRRRPCAVRRIGQSSMRIQQAFFATTSCVCSTHRSLHALNSVLPHFLQRTPLALFSLLLLHALLGLYLSFLRLLGLILSVLCYLAPPEPSLLSLVFLAPPEPLFLSLAYFGLHEPSLPSLVPPALSSLLAPPAFSCFLPLAPLALFSFIAPPAFLFFLPSPRTRFPRDQTSLLLPARARFLHLPTLSWRRL